MEVHNQDETHVLNKRLERIEPTTKKCSYCIDEKIIRHVNDCYFVPIFSEKDRTNLIVYRSVKFKKIVIGIPRCASCKAIHAGAQIKGIIISLIVALLIVAVIVYNFLLFHPIVSVVLFFISVGALVFGHVNLQNIFTKQKGIYTLKAGATKDYLVHSFLMKGWSFTQPSA